MIRVALDGLRSRTLLSVGTLLLLVVALGSAVLGPAFAAAVGNAYAVTRLSEERNVLTGRTWEVRPSTTTEDPGALLDDTLAQLVLPEDQHAPSAQLETARVLAPGALGEVMLMAKPDACTHLDLEGRCPTAPGEVAVLAGDAEEDGHELGDRIDLGRPFGTLTLVGTYAYPSGPTVPAERREALEDFWFEPGRLASVPATVRPDGQQGTEIPRQPAPYLVAPDQLAGLPPQLILVRVDSRIEVPADLDAADLPALAERAAADPAPQQLEVGTAAEISNNDLDGIVADVDRERRAALLAVAPAVVSLVLVALALLSRLTSAAGELRVPDLALASLRGADRRRTWLLALSEPLLLVAVAVPFGVAGGAALTWALVRAWLPAGVPVPLPSYVVLACVAVVACAVAVCVVSTRAVLARSLADQLSGQSRPRPAGRLAVLGALALVALTAVLVGAALTRPAGGATDAADLALPLLIAAVLGLGAAGGARAAARALARRPARGVAGFLAVRAVARRSVGTLVVLPLTIAIAVVTFGAGTFDAAGAWRASVAATQAPASTVWSSELPMREAVALTHRLDPDGRWLMATGTWNAQDGVYVVADAPRLSAASVWDPSWTPGHGVDDVVGLITRPSPPALTGTRLRLGLTVPRAAEEVTVEMRMRTAGGDTFNAYVGPFPPGETTSTERVPCEDGCTIEGLALAGPAGLPTALTGDYVVGPLEVDGRDASEVLTGGDWHLVGEGITQAAQDVRVEGPGLVVTAAGTGKAGLTSGAGGLRPVVAGREAVDRLGRVAAGAATSTVGGPPPSEAALVAESVPFLGPEGVLIDYAVLTTNRTVYEEEFEVRVLAAADTPERVSTELARQGLTVERLFAQERERLDSTAYALALRLYLVAAVLVLLMAVAGLVVTTAIQLPGRRMDAAALSVVGVRRRSVLLAVGVEQVVVLGAAAVAGLLAGAAAQLIVLGRITLGQVEEASWPRVVARVDPALLSVTALVVAVLLGTVALLSAWVTVRRARGASLREKAR
ncbi:FtsX-like permease family protein [uncultured Nocardioides sp.]|uniref:FtsX-like permease family protein n=1 Tax=uncultured Nocardioides sp. TaxID=198441 RepID=UPI00261F6D22|nr:FtsX-like permease family protein [uncultured Nocardioides sp.]